MLTITSKIHYTATAKSLQSCPTLCDPIDGSPPGFPVPGILQARTLEWVAISFSHAWKWKVKAKSLSHIWLSATLWTAAFQAPPSMGFSRQEYWSVVPLPSPSRSLLLSKSPKCPTDKQELLGKHFLPKSHPADLSLTLISLTLEMERTWGPFTPVSLNSAKFQHPGAEVFLWTLYVQWQKKS